MKLSLPEEIALRAILSKRINWKYKGANMIGISFSRCVAEIAASKVAIDDVEKIYSRTATDDWEKTIEDYKSYWENIFSLVCQDDLSDENCLLFVGKCQQIAKQILPKVFQPRIENNKYPDCNRTFWVESEDEIVWRDDSLKFSILFT